MGGWVDGRIVMVMVGDRCVIYDLCLYMPTTTVDINLGVKLITASPPELTVAVKLQPSHNADTSTALELTVPSGPVMSALRAIVISGNYPRHSPNFGCMQEWDGPPHMDTSHGTILFTLINYECYRHGPTAVLPNQLGLAQVIQKTLDGCLQEA